MADPYLVVAGFKSRSIVPSSDVDDIETLESGWTDQSLASWSDEINARLQKRYAVPFGTAGTPRTDVPPTILRWLVALTTRDVYFKRGSNPASAQDAEAIRGMAERAEAELSEAANSETGLFELPLKASAAGSAITRGGPLALTETSPYVWTDRQVDVGRDEDANG
jgi:hypothetical protein